MRSNRIRATMFEDDEDDIISGPILFCAASLFLVVLIAWLAS